MGLWSQLFDLLDWGLEMLSTPPQPHVPRSSRTGPVSGLAPGAVHRGTVEYLGDSFAIVQAPAVKAIVFMSEMAHYRIEIPDEVLVEREAVEFVLLRPNDRKPGEWVASISAVGEAHAREELSRLSEGNQVSGEVCELKDSGAKLICGQYCTWVPFSELSWGHLHHPSDILSLGQRLTVKILRIELPDGWLTDKRSRRAQVVGSLRFCLPQPESPNVDVAFTGFPCKVWAVVKKPRSCDSVVMYVLEELVNGRTPEEIQSITGLPGSAVASLVQVLNDEHLAVGWRLESKGVQLVEAFKLARELNQILYEDSSPVQRTHHRRS